MGAQYLSVGRELIVLNGKSPVSVVGDAVTYEAYVDEVLGLSANFGPPTPVPPVEWWAPYEPVTLENPTSVDTATISFDTPGRYPLELYAKNACGTTTGDVWSFITIQAIEINSDITTNQLWTANNIYYVTDWVNVQALLVIEPGTMVIFGYDCGLFVNNGGTLISKGTPDKPIIYTCDFMYFYYPEDIGYYWWYIYYGYGPYYFSPIYIEETASPATTVTYSFIEGAVVGIATENIAMDHPIENNYLFGNIYGIGEYGTKHTDIKNNLCFFNDYSGIDVDLADVNGIADANSHILIQNNTCDAYQYYGITVHGVEDGNNAGSVMLVNNIVTESYWCGLNLVDGYMRFDVRNTGYFGNYMNKNWEFDEYDPVEATQGPYRHIEGGDYFDIRYLDPNCVFINAGLGYIEETPLIGMTTDINGTPDGNFVDLGFHHPSWSYSNEPNIIPTISGDPNNMTGEVSIGVSGYGVTTERAFLLMDGEYMGELEYFDSNTPLLIDTDNYRNGNHSIKLVVIDVNGLVTVSDTLETYFNNTFFNIIASDYFHPTADYNVLGFHNGTGSFEAKVTNLVDGQILWSNTYSGPSVNIVIPGAAFGNAQLCELSMSGSGITKKDLTKEFNQADCPAGVRMVIVLPNKDVFKRRIPAILECARACDQRNVSWVSLYHHDVTEDNLRFLYNKSSVKYVYWCGHANSHEGKVQRTHTECWRYEPSWWHFNWQKIGVFSWTRQTRDFPPLPDNWDNRGFDLWTLPMHDQWNKKIVFVDGCLSAKYDDMAKAYGMYSLQGQGSSDQIYIGWRIAVQEGVGIVDIFAGDTTAGVKLFWERMGRDSENSVGEALQWTCDHYTSDRMLMTMWGLNVHTDFGDVDGDDNIFVRGNGFVNFNKIKLEP
jgi:hypothetical protein